MNAPDPALLEAWRAGDRAAGEALFERYFGPVCRFFANKCPDDLDDLVQETFSGLVQGRDRVSSPRLRSYVFGIAHNVLRAHLRKRSHEPWSEDDGLAARDASPSTLLTRRDEHRVLLEGLRRLPLAQQVALELTFWERLEGNEIAEALGVPLGTVRTRIRDGRARLRQEIEALASSQRLVTTQTDLERWAEEIRLQSLPPGHSSNNDPGGRTA